MDKNKVIAEFLVVCWHCWLVSELEDYTEGCNTPAEFQCYDCKVRMSAKEALPNPDYSTPSGMIDMLKGLDKKGLLLDFQNSLTKDTANKEQYGYELNLYLFTNCILDPTLCRDKVAEWIMERQK